MTFKVPQALFTVTNVANFVNVNRKTELDDMLTHLTDLLSTVHGNDPLLKSDMFSRLYILSLKSFGDYVQFEFVKECNRLLSDRNDRNDRNDKKATKLFITSTDVIAYSQGICNNVPILAGMINPDIFWLFEDIRKKIPSIPDDMKLYMDYNASKRALHFKHIGLFYEGNMNLDSLSSGNTKLTEGNWERTMKTIVNDLNTIDNSAGFQYLQSKEQFQNWITSTIQLTLKDNINIINEESIIIEFKPAFFNNQSADIPLRSIHKYVNDITNIHYIGQYLMKFPDIKQMTNATLNILKKLRGDVALYYDVYLKNSEDSRVQILIEYKDEDTYATQRRSPRLQTKYYKINPNLDFDYVWYIQSYKDVYSVFLKLTQLIIDLLQIEDSINTLLEDSGSIKQEMLQKIKTILTGKFMEVVESTLIDDINDVIKKYGELGFKKYGALEKDELSVNTILQQLKDLRQSGDVQVHEKDFIFNAEIELTNFINVYRNMKKRFTKLKSGYNKIKEIAEKTEPQTEPQTEPELVNNKVVNTEDKPKDPTSQNGEKGLALPKFIQDAWSNLNLKRKRKRQEERVVEGTVEGAVTRAQAAIQAAYDKGPASGTRQAAQKQQRIIGGANKSAYMKSLKKADEDLAKYLKKKCSIKLLK